MKNDDDIMGTMLSAKMTFRRDGQLFRAVIEIINYDEKFVHPYVLFFGVRSTTTGESQQLNIQILEEKHYFCVLITLWQHVSQIDIKHG